VINWFQGKELIRYLVTAQSIRSVHSPFVFDFAKYVLRDERKFYCYEEAEKLREAFLVSEEFVEVDDRGAGSKFSAAHRRSLKSIAQRTATPAKYAQLLFRMGVHYGSRNILEMGTSLGLTTLYLSSISRDARVITIEGDEKIADVASMNFESLSKKNISLLRGSFEEMLPTALKQLEKADLIYLDGNHRREATLNYFQQSLPCIHEKSIVIIGDIHWSKEMKEAWEEIISNPAATATIDLFYLGIIFFKKELSKQDFVIRW